MKSIAWIAALTKLFHVASVVAQEGCVGFVPRKENVALHLHATHVGSADGCISVLEVVWWSPLGCWD